MLNPVVIILNNFSPATRVTDVARLVGSLLRFKGDDWNSLYAIIKIPNKLPRSCSFVIKLRDLTYYIKLRHANHVKFEDGILKFTFRNRAIRGARLKEKTFKLAIERTDEGDWDQAYTASFARTYKDIKDVIIRLENHFSHSLDYVCSISVSKKQFYVDFLNEQKLQEFTSDPYFGRFVKISQTCLHLDMCQRVVVSSES